MWKHIENRLTTQVFSAACTEKTTLNFIFWSFLWFPLSLFILFPQSHTLESVHSASLCCHITITNVQLPCQVLAELSQPSCLPIQLFLNGTGLYLSRVSREKKYSYIAIVLAICCYSTQFVRKTQVTWWIATSKYDRLLCANYHNHANNAVDFRLP